MNCRGVRSRLSAHLDGELRPGDTHALVRHLAACAACAGELDALRDATEALRELPRVDPGESIAARVFDRLEVESRGPGLALLFRSAWAARPLMLPSLVPALMVLALTLGGALMLSGEPELPPVAEATAAALPPAGTEGNPLFIAAMPERRAGPELTRDVFAELEEGSDFFQTIVARDGSVADVLLLEGNAASAGPLADALRRERFEPALIQGRPVARSVFWLISRVEVRAPVT